MIKSYPTCSSAAYLKLLSQEQKARLTAPQGAGLVSVARLRLVVNSLQEHLHNIGWLAETLQVMINR